MDAHVPGLELSRSFYNEVIRDLVRVPHAAALLGEGSEVLGYDQARSTDHSWGPRLQIFTAPENVNEITRSIEGGFPAEFKGFPVRFFSWQTETVRHHVEVTTLEQYLNGRLGFGGVTAMTPSNWLAAPQQHLLQFTAGAVFNDDTGELTRARRLLAWYPNDVWLWMMASQWHLIGNTQPLLGRTLEAGDARGATLIAFRLVRLVMELAFLQERQYWPYPKWFGTAFASLTAAKALGPLLDAVAKYDFPAKEEELNHALYILGGQHCSLGLTSTVTPKIDDFQVGVNNAVRPYKVINAGDYVKACKAGIADKRLREMPAVGAIDQVTHADDLLVNFSTWPKKLEGLYRDYLDPAPPKSSSKR